MIPHLFSRLPGALIAISLCGLASAASAAELQLQINKLADRNGALHVFVFTSPNGFPAEASASLHHVQNGPHEASVKLKLDVPESKEYAVMVYQDKNGDGRMNRFLGMIPQEPYALSRNPKVIGKPSFADSAVHPGSDELIVLDLRD